MPIESLHVGNAEGEGLTVTMRGDATDIVHVLVNGLPREALVQIQDALVRELETRGKSHA